MAVISSEKFNLLNINDCPFELAKNTLETIKKKYEIDLLLLGYGGAGPYPQCFMNLNEKEKIKEAKKKMLFFLNQSCNFIKEIEPKYYMPFAGTYVLGGKLSKLQKIRGVPDIEQAHTYIKKELKSKNEIKSQGLRLNNDSTFCLKSEKLSEKYSPLKPDLIKKYISEKLSKKIFSYEQDKVPSLEEIFELSKISHKRYMDKKKQFKINLDMDILLKVENKYIFIDNKSNKLSIIDDKELSKLKKYVIYDVDSKLLKRILKGPKYAHWNNAEIGSHIKFERNPEKYERGLYYCLSYFHA